MCLYLSLNLIVYYSIIALHPTGKPYDYIHSLLQVKIIVKRRQMGSYNLPKGSIIALLLIQNVEYQTCEISPEFDTKQRLKKLSNTLYSNNKKSLYLY